MENEAGDRLLTVEQAGRYIGVGQSSIRNYIKQGKLKAYRVCGKRVVRIWLSDVLGIVEDNPIEERAVNNGASD